MLQQCQIVKALEWQIDIEDTFYAKDAITSFHSIDWMIIAVNVTIYRTVSLQRYLSSSSHSIMIITTNLRSSI